MKHLLPFALGLPLCTAEHLLHSRNIPSASLSYKQAKICEGPPSYSGYVTLPPDSQRTPNPSNLFFYYVESAKPSAPLTIFLGGGPGASSISSMMTEVGPCTVNPDSNSTSRNPWAWTRESHMLFIDQPVQTGFSYDVLTDGIIDYLTLDITPANFTGGTPDLTRNMTLGAGVFGSQMVQGTVNSTTNGAHVMWDFMQVWLDLFPEHKSGRNQMHLWTESFGGRYGPEYTAYFLRQNERIARGELRNQRPIRIDTLGIHNGCSDLVTQGGFYPEFAYNNTYNFPVISDQQYEETKAHLTKPGGCFDLAGQCRALAAELDPMNLGNNAKVNNACLAADQYCYQNCFLPFALSGRNIHDMAQFTTTTPQPYSNGFLNQAWVQQSIGAAVNFTSNSNTVYNAFGVTGNALITRGSAMTDFAYIMARGVKVNLVYGDRDYICNWMGGENVSLSINHKDAASFRRSGYQNLITNSSYSGGVVRQAGHLSFTRVFQAGHAAPAFQPETLFRVFSRIMNSRDIATGRISVGDQQGKHYHTIGPKTTFHIKNVLPEPPAPVCYTLSSGSTCTAKQQGALLNGTAVVQDFRVVWPTV